MMLRLVLLDVVTMDEVGHFVFHLFVPVGDLANGNGNERHDLFDDKIVHALVIAEAKSSIRNLDRHGRGREIGMTHKMRHESKRAHFREARLTRART